jgi:hypothetical protein
MRRGTAGNSMCRSWLRLSQMIRDELNRYQMRWFIIEDDVDEDMD